MCSACRPLKWQEIQGSLSIDQSALDINLQELKSSVHVRDICGSLITPACRSARIGAQYYRIVSCRKVKVDSPDVNKQLTEWNLASLCMRYLTFPCLDEEVASLVFGKTCAMDALPFRTTLQRTGPTMWHSLHMGIRLPKTPLSSRRGSFECSSIRVCYEL